MENIREIAILEMASTFLESVLDELESDVAAAVYIIENEPIPEATKETLIDIVEYYNSLLYIKNTIDIVRQEGDKEDMSQVIKGLGDIIELLPDDLRNAVSNYLTGPKYFN